MPTKVQRQDPQPMVHQSFGKSAAFARGVKYPLGGEQGMQEYHGTLGGISGLSGGNGEQEAGRRCQRHEFAAVSGRRNTWPAEGSTQHEQGGEVSTKGDG